MAQKKPVAIPSSEARALRRLGDVTASPTSTDTPTPTSAADTASPTSTDTPTFTPPPTPTPDAPTPAPEEPESPSPTPFDTPVLFPPGGQNPPNGPALRMSATPAPTPLMPKGSYDPEGPNSATYVDYTHIDYDTSEPCDCYPNTTFVDLWRST